MSLFPSRLFWRALTRKKTKRERKTFAELYQTYKPCLLRITGRNREGDTVTGTAFHLGKGYLATARHVVDGMEIIEIVPGAEYYSHGAVNVRKIHFHDGNDIDLAVLETDFSFENYMKSVLLFEKTGKLREKVDHIPIGEHLDDLIGDDFVMSKAMLIGFPPIPRANEAVAVAVEVEVNAAIDRYDLPHAHFVISAVPRGGFSGGPVFSEHEFLLGIMTDSLYGDEQSYETGFAAAISVEPLLDLLVSAGIECGENSDVARNLIGNLRPQLRAVAAGTGLSTKRSH